MFAGKPLMTLALVASLGTIVIGGVWGGDNAELMIEGGMGGLGLLGITAMVVKRARAKKARAETDEK